MVKIPSVSVATPTPTVPAGATRRAAGALPARPFSQVGSGKKRRFVMENGQPANVRPVDESMSEWIWDDGVITDVEGKPLAGPVRDDAGAVVGYVDGTGKPIEKSVYDLYAGDSPEEVMPDAVDASDPAGASISIPDEVAGPDVVVTAPDDPNVAASAPTVATPSPERSAQIARLRRDIFQVGGDLENPSLDYPVSQDDINRLATAISDLTPAEMAAFSADPTLNKRMELVFDSSNNQPAADASMRPGQADNERADEFLDLENGPRGERRGGATLAARAEKSGISQKDLPEVLRTRAPEDRSLATRASSETEKDPGARSVDESGKPRAVITDERLARDTPMERIRKLLVTLAGYDPQAKRYTRLNIPMDPAERVAAGDLGGGLFEDIVYDGPQGSGDRVVFQDIADETPESIASQIEDRRPELAEQIRGVSQQIDDIRRAAAEGRVNEFTAQNEIERFEAERRLLSMAWLRNDRELRRIVPDYTSVDEARTGVPVSAMPESTQVVADPNDLATFPSRRKDSAGRIPFSRRAGALEELVGVRKRLSLPADVAARNREFAATRRYTDRNYADGRTVKLSPDEMRRTRQNTVQFVVPGLIGDGGMLSSPMQFALMAAERAGMNLNGRASRPFLNEIVKVYNSVYGDYAPLRPREFAEAIARIEGPTAQAADNAVSVPDRSAELSLSPEQLDQFRDLLVRARDAIAIDHPGFGAVTWDPETRAWQIDASGPTNFVVDPSGNVVPTSRGIDSESIARQAAADVPEDELEPPVPTKGIGGPSRRRIPAQTGAQGGSQTPGDVAGDTPAPAADIPAGVDGETPAPPADIPDQIDGEIERYWRDTWSKAWPEGNPSYASFDEWWATKGEEFTARPTERQLAARRLGIPGTATGTTPGAAASPAAPATPAPAAGATPSPSPAAGGGGAGGQPPNIPPGAAGANPGAPQGPTPAAAGGGGGGGPPGNTAADDLAKAWGTGSQSQPTKPRKLRDLLTMRNAAIAAGLGTAAYVMLPRKPTLTSIAERTGGGVDPLGPPGGFPPGGMPPGGGGVDDGFSDPLADDRAVQMARALQLMQEARVPRYQTAQNFTGGTYYR